MLQNKLKRLLRTLHGVEDTLLVTLFMTMLAIAVLQVVMRNVFGHGFLWTEAAMRALVLWLTLMGALVATRRHEHIRLEALLLLLPAQAQRLCRSVASLVTAALCATAACFTTSMMLAERDMGTLLAGQIPAWMTQVIMPLAFGLMALRFAVQAFVKGKPHE